MKIRRILWFASIAAASLSGGDARAQTDVTAPHAYKLEGDIEGVHDPSIIKEGDTWYLFGTVTEKVPDGQLPIRCSKDLHLWKRCGYVFPGVLDWIKKVSPETKDLWAPRSVLF
jgi:arabinan endo-1,5-alpha-L-arabinosidase